MRNAEEGLSLRRPSLPAHGMFPALGFKQKRHSKVERSVESNLSPCFVLGTYQGEPWPREALAIELKAGHYCQAGL